MVALLGHGTHPMPSLAYPPALWLLYAFWTHLQSLMDVLWTSPNVDEWSGHRRHSSPAADEYSSAWHEEHALADVEPSLAVVAPPGHGMH